VIGWKAICEKAQWVRVLLIEWTIRPAREKSPSGEYGLRKEEDIGEVLIGERDDKRAIDVLTNHRKFAYRIKRHQRHLHPIL
jgi:hypothetical protein